MSDPSSRELAKEAATVLWRERALDAEARAAELEAKLAAVAAAIDAKLTPSLGTAHWAADPLPSCPNYAHVNGEWLLELITEAKAVRAAVGDPSPYLAEYRKKAATEAVQSLCERTPGLREQIADIAIDEYVAARADEPVDERRIRDTEPANPRQPDAEATCEHCGESETHGRCHCNAHLAPDAEAWAYEQEYHQDHGGSDTYHHIVSGDRHIAEVDTEADARLIVALHNARADEPDAAAVESAYDMIDGPSDVCKRCGKPEDGRRIVRLQVGGWEHYSPCWLLSLDEAEALDAEAAHNKCPFDCEKPGYAWNAACPVHGREAAHNEEPR